MELDEVTKVVLPPEKVSPNAFHFIYDWMLSSNSKVHRQCFLEIFVAATFLRINELIEQCYTCMDSKGHFQEDTAFSLYLEGKKLGDPVTPALMISRVSRFFLILVASKEFIEFSLQEVLTLLSSHNIAVHSETEVLFSALRWIYFDWDARQSHLVSVMKCIRFGLLPPWQLVELTRSSNSPEIRPLMEVQEIYKMVEDGLHYVISKYYYGDDDFLYSVSSILVH